jgi:hypothetical protein
MNCVNDCFFLCRNVTYGWKNDENKRALHKAGGIQLLIRLLMRSPEPVVHDLVIGVFWNLSSCEVCSHLTESPNVFDTFLITSCFQELKRVIVDEALTVLVRKVIIPQSGWDRENPGPTLWSCCLRNALGILKFVNGTLH